MLAATQTGALMGTPYYMSPEQMRGSAGLDGRTDLYSMGAVLFHALTGRVPFVADTFPSLVMAVVTDDPPAPRSLRSDIPLSLEAAILRALAKDRERRFPDADEFAAALVDTLGPLGPLGVTGKVGVDSPASP
jgi:serine/threonine-protein kinase